MLLYHASPYLTDTLKPGFEITGTLTTWDGTESNRFLYSSTDLNEACLNAVCSKIDSDKSVSVSRYRFDDKNFIVHLSSGKLTESDIRKHFVYLYQIDSSDEWSAVNNAYNGSSTEYKTARSIKPNSVAKITNPIGNRKIKIMHPMTIVSEFGHEDYSVFKSLLGMPQVTVRNNRVKISSLRNASLLEQGLKKVYGTTRIAMHMIEIRSSSISFLEFFLPDVVFMMKTLAENKRIWGSISNTAKRVHDLLMEHTWMTRQNDQVPQRLDRAKLKDLVYSPLDFQSEFFEYFETNVYQMSLKGFLFAGAAGSGKAQPDTAMVKIPNGWKAMGDICADDLVVTPDGNHTRVSAVFPQGMKKIYQIQTADGRTTQACGEHLWEVILPDQNIFRRPNVIDTIAVLSIMNKGIPVFIPTVFSCSPEDIPLPTEAKFCKPSELIEASAHQKDEYFRNLIGDNYRYMNCEIELYGKDRDDFVALVRSFGGVAGPVIMVNDRAVLRYYFDGLVEISTIDRVEDQYARCIMVEDPRHLYITDQYIATHNTFTSLALAHCSGSDMTIVVSPKNAIDRVWRANILEVFRDKPTFWVSDESSEFSGTENFIVVHYEYLQKLLDQLGRLKFKRLSIILDESHNFNEAGSGRTAKFLELCETLDKAEVIWLSGTPIKALSSEAIPLIRCIDPLFTPEAEDVFRKVYKGESTAATAVLSNRLGLMSFKVGKERLNLKPPVFHNYPVAFMGSEEFTLETIKTKMAEFIKQRAEYYKGRQKSDEQHYLDMVARYELKAKSAEERSALNEYRNSVKIIRNTGAIGVPDHLVAANAFELKQIKPLLNGEEWIRFRETKTIYKYVHLKIQGECLGQIVGRARIKCHVEMAKRLDYTPVLESTTKKTVVFSSYVDVIKAAAEVLQKQDYSPLMVYAETTGRLSSIVSQFGEDPEINPLIATFAALSTAVPLIMADTMILIDVPFRDYILQQAVSRIHRLGQLNDTHVFTAILDTGELPNISTRTVDILKWSQKQIESIVGMKSPFELTDGTEVAFESDIDREPCLENDFISGLGQMLNLIDPAESAKSVLAYESWSSNINSPILTQRVSWAKPDKKPATKSWKF